MVGHRHGGKSQTVMWGARALRDAAEKRFETFRAASLGGAKAFTLRHAPPHIFRAASLGGAKAFTLRHASGRVAVSFVLFALGRPPIHFSMFACQIRNGSVLFCANSYEGHYITERCLRKLIAYYRISQETRIEFCFVSRYYGALLSACARPTRAAGL
jgi:hypothetical protein